MPRMQVLVQLLKPLCRKPGEPQEFQVLNKRDMAFQVLVQNPKEGLTKAVESFKEKYGGDYIIRAANLQTRDRVRIAITPAADVVQKAGPDFVKYRRTLHSPHVSKRNG